MARYLLLAMNGPTGGEGDEDRFNKWYDETHLPDLLAVGGVVSAQRYKVVQSNQHWPYVAAYEIETDDLAAVMQEMTATLATFPPEFDRANSANLLAIEIPGR